mmetsp:Transcript_9317/g.28014  ORF Transcript_9317/g.28014 Transcript_9317/m.28014 type:complete len:204 (-) Transcript_9317:861-1472(-)
MLAALVLLPLTHPKRQSQLHPHLQQLPQQCPHPPQWKLQPPPRKLHSHRRQVNLQPPLPWWSGRAQCQSASRCLSRSQTPMRRLARLHALTAQRPPHCRRVPGTACRSRRWVTSWGRRQRLRLPRCNLPPPRRRHSPRRSTTFRMRMIHPRTVPRRSAGVQWGAMRATWHAPCMPPPSCPPPPPLPQRVPQCQSPKSQWRARQ